MPWVSAYREQQKDEGSTLADTVLDCDWCKKNVAKKTRAMLGCGWMSPDKRTASDFFTPKGAPRPEECPGYLISLPEVYEASRALGWKRDGCIREFYPEGLTTMAMDAIDTVDSAIRSVERHSIRQSRLDSKRRSKK